MAQKSITHDDFKIFLDGQNLRNFDIDTAEIDVNDNN